jgi:hypothetical protein
MTESSSSSSSSLSQQHGAVKVAAMTCLLSLSRSVFQLRTLFQEMHFWRLLRWFGSSQAPVAPPMEIFAAATALMCNLLLQFSPCRETILEAGAIEILCAATKREDQSIRLNGVWALMNVAFQADQATKSQILTCLGTDQVFSLLSETDERILIKTLGLIRNILATRCHIDFFMGLYGRHIVQAVVLVLEADHSTSVKEQALCILSNIADGESAKDYIIENEDVLKKIAAYLRHSDVDLVKAAVGCVFNLVHCPLLLEPADDDEDVVAANDSGDIRDAATDRHKKLREIGIYSILQQLGNSSADPNLLERVREILTQFSIE